MNYENEKAVQIKIKHVIRYAMTFVVLARTPFCSIITFRWSALVVHSRSEQIDCRIVYRHGITLVSCWFCTCFGLQYYHLEAITAKTHSRSSYVNFSCSLLLSATQSVIRNIIAPSCLRKMSH